MSLFTETAVAMFDDALAYNTVMRNPEQFTGLAPLAGVDVGSPASVSPDATPFNELAAINDLPGH